MINKDRIVPVHMTDLLSLYSVILMQNGDNSSMAKADPSDVEGNFTISSTGVKICSQPLKSCNITGASATIYFMADKAYEGFALNGVAETPQDGSVDVVADGSLYKCVLSSGDITITRVGF